MALLLLEVSCSQFSRISKKMLGFTEIQRYSPNFRIRQILLKTFGFCLLFACVQVGCFLSCVCPTARKVGQSVRLAKSVGAGMLGTIVVRSISCDFHAEAGNPSIVSELHLHL